MSPKLFYSVLVLLVLTTSSYAQSAPSRKPYEAYLEVDGYVNAKIREMRQKGKRVTYEDQQSLEEKKKTLAKNSANLLSSSPSLKGEDLYYVAILYFIGDDFNKSYTLIKSFLSQYPSDAKGELIQMARTYGLIIAARKRLPAEAESFYLSWVNSEPSMKNRQPMMENILAVALYKDQQYAKALQYGQEAFDLLKTFQPVTIKEKRDVEQLYANMVEVLSLSYKKDKKQDLALNILAEARARSFTIPSANLYREVMKFVESSSFSEKKLMQKIESYSTANPAPEIEMLDWIGQEPMKFEQLRGKVVLLDFWATWCGPCISTFPRLRALHNKYTEKGLVIVGVTELYGIGDGKSMSKLEELDYLNEFKKKHELPYSFAIVEDGEDASKFGVNAYPTTFLLDRKGVVRYIGIGAGGEEANNLESIISKLIKE